MFDNEDMLIVYMTQSIDNLYSKTVNYRPNIENFDDLVINVEVEPEARSALKAALTASHKIEFDALRDEEVKILAKKKTDSISIFQPAAEVES